MDTISLFQLENKKFRDELAASLIIDIDDACLELYPTRYSRRVGMGSIGEPCARKLWYKFRWVKEEPFDGRMLRLLDRGTREEKRFVDWLIKAGCKVSSLDPETNKQYELSDCNGHFSGFLDAKILLPPKYKIKEWILGEFKTWREDGKWRKLKKDGLYKTKQEHYDQMCMYGYKAGLKFGLYVAICKNDDRIYIEIVPLSEIIAIELLRKAKSIITAPIDAPPAKISMQRSFFSCKWCCFKDICHDGDQVDKNCRSCKYSNATDNAQWYCAVHKQIIPPEAIPHGCNQYSSLQ